MISVLMATRDRAAILARTLDAMARVQPPTGGWRLIVVDNGSVDDTADVIRSASAVLPITALRCEAPGASAARNIALPHLDGDLAVCADDDILPAPDWLDAYRRAADRHPNVTLFGGTIEPEWPGELPAWLWTDPRAMGVLYAVATPEDGPCRPKEVYGPHWAVRAAVFRDGVRFHGGLGPVAGALVYAMGDESELFQQLEAKGCRARHVAAARARHIVRPEQLTEPWILNRAFSCGKGAVALGADGRRPARRLAYAAAAWLMRPLPPSRLRLRVLFTQKVLEGMAAT